MAKKKSLFGSVESELKKHIEANKSKVVDITSNEDVVADELAQLKAIENAQNKQSSSPSSFDLPDPEELDKLMQNFEEENEGDNFERKLEEEETKKFENPLEETLEKQNKKAEEVEKNIRFKTNAATIRHHYAKKTIKEASDEANERQKESEKFKVEVNKLMSTFGYSFMDAKKIYEAQIEEDKEQNKPKSLNHNIIVTPINQKKK